MGIMEYRWRKWVNRFLLTLIESGRERKTAFFLMGDRWFFETAEECNACDDLIEKGLIFLESRGWLNCDKCRSEWGYKTAYLVSPFGERIRPTHELWHKGSNLMEAFQDAEIKKEKEAQATQDKRDQL
jgi:hypothetical protein